jgi:hypothetical protein
MQGAFPDERTGLCFADLGDLMDPATHVPHAHGYTHQKNINGNLQGKQNY